MHYIKKINMFHLDLTMQFYEHVHLKKKEKKKKRNTIYTTLNVQYTYKYS